MKFDKIGGLMQRFRRAQQGTVAIIAALSVLPMMLAAGAALDYVRASNVQARLQVALDAAALAAAASGSLNDTARIAMAKAMFAKNWQDPETDDLEAGTSFVIRDGAVVGTAGVDVPTSIMQLTGFNAMPVEADVTVSVPVTKKAEIALVLDYSGSMTEVRGGKVKYIAMRDAAIKLVKALAATGKSKVKIGLVPFSHHVLVTLPKAFVLGQKGSGAWTGCTQDRRYPHNLSDATPIKGNDNTKWGQPQAPEHILDGCAPYAPRHLIVRPLTSSFEQITDQLKDMRPNFWTHISLGVEFGWHLLSPNAPFTEGADYSDRSTEKFMVVLTDGEQYEPAFGAGGSRTVEDGEKNLEELCKKAKQTGITMVTVAFDLEDEATTERLRNCSTDPDKHFFIAKDDDEIARAFEEITAQITARIFVSK